MEVVQERERSMSVSASSGNGSGSGGSSSSDAAAVEMDFLKQQLKVVHEQAALFSDESKDDIDNDYYSDTDSECGHQDIFDMDTWYV